MPRHVISSLVCLALIVSLAPAIIAEVPVTPTAVDGIVYARSFRLDAGYKSDWGAERPFVTEGTILVLDVEPELVRPRQSAEPVLYVGDRVAQRIHAGWPSGRMIVIVPGEVDLESDPIFFGTPELSERVDRAMAAEELARARSAGLLPLPATSITQARSLGGLSLRVFDTVGLDLKLRELYDEFVSVLPAAVPEAE